MYFGIVWGTMGVLWGNFSVLGVLWWYVLWGNFGGTLRELWSTLGYFSQFWDTFDIQGSLLCGTFWGILVRFEKLLGSLGNFGVLKALGGLFRLEVSLILFR